MAVNTNFTPISQGENPHAETFNRRLRQIDTSLEGIKDGTTTITPAVSSFANSLHDHEDAAGGGQLTDAALSVAVGLAKGGTGADLSATGPGVLRQAAAGATVAVQVDNLNASAAPTANNDSGDGVAVGSRWINPADQQVHICLDASLAGAIWRQVGSRVLLDEDVLTSSTSSISITNWPGVNTDLWTALEIEFLKARSDEASSTHETLMMQFNGDTNAANYYNQMLRVIGAAVSANEFFGTYPGIFAGQAATAVNDADYFATFRTRIILPNERGLKRPTMTCAPMIPSGTSGELRLTRFGGTWNNIVDEIASLTIIPTLGDNIIAGSHWRLWGVL